MEVPQSIMEANYNDNQEKIGRIMAYKRRAERDLQKFADALTLEDKDPERALNLVRNIAFRNASELELYPNSKLVELRYAREEPLLKAVGDIDIGRMNENIIRQRGGIEDGENL